MRFADFMHTMDEQRASLERHGQDCVFTVGVGRLLFSEELGAGQVLRLFGRRLGSYLAMLLLSRTLLAAACVPFFLALPFVWPRLVFVHEASLLEGAGPSEAIRRSSRFASGRGPSVFGALLAMLCTQGGFVIVAELLGHGLVEQVLQLGKPFGLPGRKVDRSAELPDAIRNAMRAVEDGKTAILNVVLSR